MELVFKAVLIVTALLFGVSGVIYAHAWGLGLPPKVEKAVGILFLASGLLIVIESLIAVIVYM
jgi:hypothetical protein